MSQAAPRRAVRRGELIGGAYMLRERLGSGGMGVVYAADGPHDAVAIKLLHPDRENDATAVRRLRAEAVAARYIAHRNVVAVLDFSEPGDAAPFLVMERVRGLSLGAINRRFGALPLRRVSEIARQILAGLDAAHAAGVVHADIKSDNILVEPHRDGSETVKIIDFGLATVRRPEHAAPDPEFDARGRRLMSGTPEYMAPEVIRGGIALEASDLYAVGVIMYEMITGKTPFGGGPPAEIIERHLNETVVPPSLRRPDRFIPTGLERVVMRALDTNPALRFPSASAFAAAIAAATPATEPSQPGAPRVEPPSSAFSTEATTRDFAFRRVVQRPPAGTPSLVKRRLFELRGELAGALARGAVDQVVVMSLEIARALVDDHRLWTAVRELEDTVDTLGGVASEREASVAPLWRLLLTLAALYQGLGDPRRARVAALAAHRHAKRHGAHVGCDRAATLLSRLPVARPS